MNEATRAMEAAAWAAADGIATTDQLALLEADAPGWRRALERLLDDTEDNLDAVRGLSGPERDQVVADFEDELERLELAYDLLTGAADVADAVLVAADPAGEVRLQASWSADEVVVWAGGPRRPRRPTNDELADRLEAHRRPGARLEPAPRRAAAERRPGRGAVDPRGRRARLARRRRRRPGRRRRRVQRHLARPGRGRRRAPGGPGRRRPAAAQQPPRRTARRSTCRCAGCPAVVDHDAVDELAAAMPGPGRRHGAAADAKARRARGAAAPSSTPSSPTPPAGSSCRPRRRSSAPAPTSPRRSSPASTARRSSAPVAAGPEVAKRLERWVKPVTGAGRPRLVVQLDPPDSGGAWFLSVLGPGRRGRPAADRGGAHRQPLDQAHGRRARPARAAAPGAAAGRRPATRAGVPEPGRGLGAHDRHRRQRSRPPGFEVRVPALSRRKPSPGCACSPSRRATPSSAPTSSATSAGRRCSTTSS